MSSPQCSGTQHDVTSEPATGMAMPARQRRSLRRRQSGFTILELLIVLAVIGLITGLVGPQVLKQFERSKWQTAETQVKLLQTALETFYIDMQRYPTSAEGLGVLIKAPTTPDSALWSGPYLKEDRIPADPWGKAYVYKLGETPDRPFILFSFGSDGKEGGTGTEKDVGILPPAAKN